MSRGHSNCAARDRCYAAQRGAAFFALYAFTQEHNKAMWMEFRFSQIQMSSAPALALKRP